MAARKGQRASELDEIKAVLKYFSEKERKFDGEHALNAARNLVSARNETFNELIEPLVRFHVEEAGGYVDMPGELRQALETISNAFRQELSATISTVGDSQIVRANFPLSSMGGREELRSSVSTASSATHLSVKENQDANRLWNLLTAGLLREWIKVTGRPGIMDVTRIPVSVWAAHARIEAYEFAGRWKNELIEEAHDAEREVGVVSAKVREATQGVDTIRENIDRSMVEMDGHLKDLSGLKSQLSEFNDNITKTEEAMAARYQDWALSTDERLKLRHAGKLWGQRAFWARIAWGVSFVGILALIVGVPSLGYVFKDEILGVVSQLQPPSLGSDATVVGLASSFLATASHLLLITAPLAFLVWGIRFLIRYNMRSQLLMDDATQRRTMLETYFMLVEKGVSDPKADRAVLLEAMFRPAPGHGGEAAEPMNFAELLKLGEAGKKAG